MIGACQNALTILRDDRTWIPAARKVLLSYPEKGRRLRIMTKAKLSISLAIIIVIVIAPGFAGLEKSGSLLSGSDLALELAAVARTAGATEVSRRILRVDLGGRASAPLTESTAVAILRAAGVTATTADPNRLMTRERTNTLVRQFRTSLVRPSPAGVTERSQLPAGMEACFQEKNHGLCVDCCKAEGGGPSTCAKECFVINKPSAGEPLP
jgi:hypothetical protein